MGIFDKIPSVVMMTPANRQWASGVQSSGRRNNASIRTRVSLLLTRVVYY